MNRTTKKEENLSKPYAVRFSAVIASTLEDLAKQFDTSVSNIIRLSVSNDLVRLLSSKKYFIDQKQATTINQNICALGNELQRTNDNLRRYGINLNQIAAKMNSGYQLVLADDVELLSTSTLNEMLLRIEDLAKQLGDDLNVL